jgi:uncharacterized protein involved in response to NO
MTPLFRLGFRPFFLGAGVFAALTMLLWSGIWFGGWTPTAVPVIAWHAHEMIYGYALAVVAGFLLTAARNWTGRTTATGPALAALVGAWALARLLLLAGPDALIAAAALDCTFNLALLVAVARPIVAVRQWRQVGVLAKLLLLGLGNAVFYLDALGIAHVDPRLPLHGGIFLLVALILTIAGRVLPGFIERGVRVSVQVRDPSWASRATLGLFLLFFIAELFVGNPQLVALCAAALALVTARRLVAWHTPALWREPLLWGLYVALLAIEAGFVLYAVAGVVPLPRSLPLHAFAAGGIGLATLAMMARVTLGHTGRNIRRPPPVVAIALALLGAAVVARIGVPLVAPAHYDLGIALAQGLWSAAFGCFVVVYAPMLLAPRPDGADG